MITQEEHCKLQESKPLAYSSNSPAIDVVIPTLNAGALLNKCLSSIREQDYRGPVNIIIVDGGSDDSTIRIAEKFGCEVHILNGVYSNGLNGARNLSLDWCKGTLYWQIDSDNIILGQNVLSKLVEPFFNNQDIQISIPLLSTDPKQSDVDKWLNNYEIDQLMKYSKINTKDGNVLIVDDMKYGLTNASLIRTNIIREVGGYDSDVRVFKRARNLGLTKTAIVTDAYYFHFQGQSFWKWLKKLSRRVMLFGNMGKDLEIEYFVASSHDHTYRKEFIKMPASYINFSLRLLRKGESHFYVGFLLLTGYFLIFLSHPIRFVKTYRGFL